MSVKKQNVELSSDIDFIETPAAKPSEFETGEDCGIALTKVSSFVPLPASQKLAKFSLSHQPFTMVRCQLTVLETRASPTSYWLAPSLEFPAS
jgi:hypothetical protein